MEKAELRDTEHKWFNSFRSQETAVFFFFLVMVIDEVVYPDDPVKIFDLDVM